MRSCNSLTPEEYLVCIQTSLHNLVIIKVLYKYLRRYLLGGHGSRLGFVTLYDGEVSRGPLGNTTSHTNLASNVTQVWVTWSCITEWVKRLVGNDIEIGIGIPTIKSRASNIPKDKGNVIRDYMNAWHWGSTNKIFVEYVGSNMGIEVALLDIDKGMYRVMST